MWVRHHIENVAARRLVLRRVGGDAAARVVAERDEIDGFAQRLPIFLGDRHLNAVFTEEALHIGRVTAARLHVAEEQPVAVLPLGFQQIFRLAAQRIQNAAQQHVADFALRHDP